MNSKQKGSRGERELAGVLNELLGTDCHRGQQFQGSPDSPDVTGLDGIHIECKRVEKLNIENAMDQAVRDSGEKRLPSVMHRKNRHEWLVTMRLTDWVKLYTAWKENKE